MVTLCRAMTQLEVGELGVLSFGEEARLLHRLDEPFTDDAAAWVLSQFTWAQGKSRVERALTAIMAEMDASRDRV
ncbi:MAG: hypothetical protein ACK4QW_19565, partial [Alphaproteobacteria bacterium]